MMVQNLILLQVNMITKILYSCCRLLYLKFCGFWNCEVGNNAISQSDPILDRCPEQKPAAKELPEYLKQRLRARGILGDNSCTEDIVSILS